MLLLANLLQRSPYISSLQKKKNSRWEKKKQQQQQLFYLFPLLPAKVNWMQIGLNFDYLILVRYFENLILGRYFENLTQVRYFKYLIFKMGSRIHLSQKKFSLMTRLILENYAGPCMFLLENSSILLSFVLYTIAKLYHMMFFYCFFFFFLYLHALWDSV